MLVCDRVVVTQDEFRLDADVGFAKGELTALIGPSGAGKSTLLSVIGGFFGIAEGAITWDGARIDGLAPAARPVATLFQDNNLFPHLTVAQNVGLALAPHLRLSRDQQAQVAEVLVQVGLVGMENRKPASLSGGQQSRVALARVLLQDRPVVLLDEPFAALGPAMRAEMLELVRDRLCTPERCVIMVSHDPQDVWNAADAVALVDDGIVYAPAPVAEVRADPPEALRRYMGKVG